MNTAGARGAITGKGGHLLIVDDPVKNHEEALSENTQEKTWEWYKSTFYSRLEPGGAIILIQTRWSPNDLGGKLSDEMRLGGDHWEIISLPAISEENDQLGRAVGEPLWPERYNLARLEKIKKAINNWWIPLYQQRPVAKSGGMFKWDIIEANRRAIKISDLVRIEVAVDPAVSSGTASAETGILIGGLDEHGDGYVLADASIHGTPLQWANAAVNGLLVWGADQVVGEANNGGDLVEVNIKTSTLLKPGQVVPYKKVYASRGKSIRADPVASLYAAGRIHHAGSFPELESQMCSWVPGDKSPDRLDALVWLFTSLMLEDVEEYYQIIVEDHDYQISPI